MPDDPFYKSYDWIVFRRKILQKYRYCRIPGCTQEATHVDHIVSRRAGGAPFDPWNVQLLCRSHHAEKSARFDVLSRKKSDMPVRVRGCDERGNSLDPLHPWNQAKNSRGGKV